MKEITFHDKKQATDIAKALQLFFDQNPGTTELRSTDAYHILVTKRLVERDRHYGIKFRQLLYKLKQANELTLIPQCHPIPGNDGKRTNWIFHSSPLFSRLSAKKEETKEKKEIDLEAIKNKVANFPKRNEGDLDFIAIGTRKTYPRAYEYWSKKEEELLLEVSRHIQSPLELSKLFGRQPSAIEHRLDTLD